MLAIVQNHWLSLHTLLPKFQSVHHNSTQKNIPRTFQVESICNISDTACNSTESQETLFFEAEPESMTHAANQGGKKKN